MGTQRVRRACQAAAVVILALAIALPVVADAAPRKVTRAQADQLFQSPAGPQDAALARSVKERLRAAAAANAAKAAPSSATAAPGKAAAPGAAVGSDWSANVTVDARGGHVRLVGKQLTSAQRAAAASAVEKMPDVMSWDWGN